MAPYDFTKEAKATDEELSEDLRRLGGLSDEEVVKLLPQRADQDQLKELLAAVNSAATENQKKAVLLDRLAAVSEAVTRVVAELIKVAA